VISLNAGDIHLPNDLETFLGVGIVADHIAETRIMGTPLLFDVLQNDLKRIQISVNVGNYSKLHVPLPYYFEPAKLILRIAPTRVFILDEMPKPRFPNSLTKSFQFVFCAFGNHFDSTIGQVPHNAHEVKPGGDGFHSIAKTDTLHVARVKNLHPRAIHNTAQPQSAIRGPLTGGNSRHQPALTAGIKPYSGSVRNEFLSDILHWHQTTPTALIQRRLASSKRLVVLAAGVSGGPAGAVGGLAGAVCGAEAAGAMGCKSSTGFCGWNNSGFGSATAVVVERTCSRRASSALSDSSPPVL
jgi:hypothetical protein